MKVGDVVTTTSLRVTFRNETVSGSLGYKADKGRQFVLLLLGDEPVDGEKLDPTAVLEALGWSPSAALISGKPAQETNNDAG